MSLFAVAAAGAALLAAAYLTYGRYLARKFDLRDDRETPAARVNDGVDFVPTRRAFLLGQHFSAIAAAGPIVGPILAGIYFGWLPVLLWILGGAVFLGAVHDFSSLVSSVRHGASSIVEIVKAEVGPRGHVLFLLFVWLSLIYVIIAFTDLTSASFVNPELGGGVASSSMAYLVLGLAMGVALRTFRMPLGAATLVFLPLVVLAVWGGRYLPLAAPPNPWLSPQQTWNVILLGYCFAASVIPVWLLLQPRGYLGGFFLYVTLAFGIVGLFLGGEKVQYPAFLGFVSEKGMPLFPLLFVTVACGACSGFHGIVSSGTTSKQIAKETDCRAVGYGGMLLEGLVALIALATVMVLPRESVAAGFSPDRVYAEGLARFVEHFGVPRDFARAFVLLAFTTFIYDTLDVATRLARYILQELAGWKGAAGRTAATALSLALPLACVSMTLKDAAGNVVPAWKVFWMIFGTSNQLLAALTLVVIALWLKRLGKSWWLAGVPAAFMMAMTLWALGILARPGVARLFSAAPAFDPVGLVAVLLFALAALVLVESWKSLSARR
jgi:carbon starvation protein